MSGYAHILSLRQVLRNTYTLPRFQRGSVWSAAQQAAFATNVAAGLPTASILVWKRHIPGRGVVSVVLDGQQRLTALGADVVRADGTRNPPTGAYLDPLSGTFTPEPGRFALTPRDVATLTMGQYIARERELASDPEGAALWFRVLGVMDRVGDAQIVLFVLDGYSTADFAREAFRCVNRPGVPLSEDEVDQLIAAAGEDL